MQTQYTLEKMNLQDLKEYKKEHIFLCLICQDEVLEMQKI